jgi:integrase
LPEIDTDAGATIQQGARGFQRRKGPVRLTEAVIEALKIDGRDRLVFDRLVPGFGVRVTPAGTKLYVIQARIGGRPRRVSIGRFPEKPLTEARKEARVALEDMRGGLDPVIEMAARAKALEAGDTTVNALADRWLAEYVRPKLKPRTATSYESLLEQRLRLAFGHLPVSHVTKADVLKFHAGLQETPGRANRAVSAFRALMTFAEDVGLRPIHSNPARKIKLYRERSRERFLSEAEISKAAEAIAAVERDGKIGPHAAAGLRLALFTGARSGEITAARWEHVDRARRIIRLPDSKTNKPRTIHLSDAAMEVLATVPRVGPYIVAGAKPNEPLKNLSRCWIVARKRAGLTDVRLHDLRHSYASLAAARGVSLQMIGKLLGHKVPATTQRYAHLARDAVAAINDELGDAMTDAIAKGGPADANVVKLSRPNTRRQ